MSIRPAARLLLSASVVFALGACSAERATAPTSKRAPVAAALDDVSSTPTCRNGYSVPDGRAC